MICMAIFFFLFLSYYFFMKHLCRFIIIICMFFISLAANAFDSHLCSSISKHTDTISAVQYNDYDILYSKSGASILQNVVRHDSININNKESDNSYDGGLKYLQTLVSQFENLLSYIYTQSFLRNKAKVSFHIALSEIQPNAP